MRGAAVAPLTPPDFFGGIGRPCTGRLRIIDARVICLVDPPAVPTQSRPSEDPRGFPSQSPLASAAAVSLVEVP